MTAFGQTMRVFEPVPGVLAFYDGRIPGPRLVSDAPNWFDDGAYGLGACSYAVLNGSEALVYDTHMSTAHAALIRRRIEEAGASSLRVVLSHWHADHVAGNEVFADCPIIASRLTAETLAAARGSLETGLPPIRPLVLPTETFADELTLRVGAVTVELRQVDIHSRDGVAMLLPAHGILFPGDALEDPVTYVTEPGRLRHHLVDLERMASWNPRAILPNHGSPSVIASGGYGPGLIAATRDYIAKLLRVPTEGDLAGLGLSEFAADILGRSEISYYAPYEAVHRRNVDAVLAAGAG